MTDADFEARLWLSTVQLCRVDSRDKPPGAFASGCILDYAGKRLLLTAAHATKDQGNWAIQLRYEPGKGTQLYSLGPMRFLASLSILEVARDPVLIDFSYVEVPRDIQATRQEIDPTRDLVLREFPIQAVSSYLADLPTFEEDYGFCGSTQHTWREQLKHLGGETGIYSGLSFRRTERDFHYFSLPFNHPGHHFFRGCSGAPILSRSGALVALLCGGDRSTNEVYGVSVGAYKTPIDILVREAAEDAQKP